MEIFAGLLPEVVATGAGICDKALMSRQNRVVTCEAYIAVFPQFKGRVEYLEEQIKALQCSCCSVAVVVILTIKGTGRVIALGTSNHGPVPLIV